MPLEWRKGFPKCLCIYFVIANKKVIYIGRTANLQKRWYNHHRQAELESIGGVKIAWMQVNKRTPLPEIEKELIQYFKPSLNSQLIKIRNESFTACEYEFTKTSVISFVQAAKKNTSSVEEFLFSMRGSLLQEFAQLLEIQPDLIEQFTKIHSDGRVDMHLFYEPPTYALMIRRHIVLAILDKSCVGSDRRFYQPEISFSNS